MNTKAAHPFPARTGLNGFSLVELMVALTIGLIILAAASALLATSKKTFTTQDRLARVQENGRFAMQYLMKDLRLAGYFGCADDITTVNNKTNFTTNPIYDAANPLEGFEQGTTQFYPSGSTSLVPSGINSGTDALLIRMIDPSTAISISNEMPRTSAEIDVSSVSGLSDNDIVMLTDCSSADLFQITQVQTASLKLQHNAGAGSPGNSTQVLSKIYGTNAKVMKYTARRYYIDTGSSGNPALFRITNSGTPEELVDGIENLQVLYGKDTDGDKVPNVYLKANDASLATAADWINVVSVRIGILAVTVNTKDVDKDTNSYDVNGEAIPAQNDRNKRRVFLTTAMLRNIR